MLLRPRGIKEAYWACGGALLLIADPSCFRCVRQGRLSIRGLDVYLFLTGMMILAEMAREEGVFDWIADVAGRRAHGSSKRLFLFTYLAGTVVTALLSNDATAVVLTPAVLAVVRKAKIDPKPHLLACAFIANAASFILPISNPANLVIFAKHMPPLMSWLKIFTLPSIAAVAITFVVLRLMLRSELKDKIQDLEVPVALTTEGKLALSGLVLARSSSYRGFGYWLGSGSTHLWCGGGGAVDGRLAGPRGAQACCYRRVVGSNPAGRGTFRDGTGAGSRGSASPRGERTSSGSAAFRRRWGISPSRLPWELFPT